MSCPATGETLRTWVEDARSRSFELVEDLSDEQCAVPRVDIVTPFLWELGHVAWFQEKWVLRHVHSRDAMLDGADALFDSANVPHATRWDLPMPSRRRVLQYCHEVRDRVLELLGDGEPSDDARYFFELSVYHEDMHAEAFTYVRQTLGLPRPRVCHAETPSGTPCPGDVVVPATTFSLGGAETMPFVFDNEKWAHEVQVDEFRIARTCVTQGEFAQFVEDGGYERPEFWSPAGRDFRARTGSAHPIYWRRGPGGWQVRSFDRWNPLDPDTAVSHVCWFEADAFCRWAGRRLPTEAEWELAAGGPHKQRYPWCDDSGQPDDLVLEWQTDGSADARAGAAGDSPFGCRQMLGNVWEWTSSTFEPFPGFVVDPYKEYSAPFFGTRKVLRGGSWASTLRMLRNTWRNYFEPHRRDIIAGFRTCALDE